MAKKSTTKSSEKFNPEKPLANDRREKFCQLIVDGKKPSEAYKKAYKCSQEVAVASVSRMLGYVEVKARIQHLREQLAEDKAERRRRKLDVCQSIWSDESLDEDGDYRISPSDRLRAIDIDNKMCGDYEPLKVEVEGELDINLVSVSESILELAQTARRERHEELRKKVSK